MGWEDIDKLVKEECSAIENEIANYNKNAPDGCSVTTAWVDREINISDKKKEELPKSI